MICEIDLEPVSSQNETDSQRRIFDVISANLHKQNEASAKAAALADDIRRLGAVQKSRSDVSEFLDALWVNLVEIACYTPPGHPWQDTLVQAVQNLQQTGGRVWQGDETQDLDWKDLPDLSVPMREMWFDPTDLDDWTPEDVSRWKNLNSFAARITTSSFAPWLTFPTWQLRSALEEELDKGPVLDSRLWTATEWVLFCGEIVVEYMAYEEELDEALARALATGPLCFDVNPRSVERVEFWKKRLLEVSAEKEALGLSAELTERVSRATERLGGCRGGGHPQHPSLLVRWWQWLMGTT